MKWRLERRKAGADRLNKVLKSGNYWVVGDAVEHREHTRASGKSRRGGTPADRPRMVYPLRLWLMRNGWEESESNVLLLWRSRKPDERKRKDENRNMRI